MLGTTEARLNTLLDLACVVVLEGTACFAWCLAGIRLVVGGRAAVASDRTAILFQQEAIVSVLKAMPVTPIRPTHSHAAATFGHESVVGGGGGSASMSEDDLLVVKIHEAVVAGRLTRNLASILQCGQPKASRLYRLYLDGFGESGCRVTAQCD